MADEAGRRSDSRLDASDAGGNQASVNLHETGGPQCFTRSDARACVHVFAWGRSIERSPNNAPESAATPIPTGGTNIA